MTYQKIKLTIQLLFISYTIFFALPLAISYFTDGLSKEQIVEKLPSKIKTSYVSNENDILEMKLAIESIQYNLVKNNGQYQSEKIATIKYLNGEIARRNKYFRIAGFSYNRLSYIYPLSIFLLSFIYFVILDAKNIYSIKDQLKVAIPVYIFQSSFTWYRNSPLGQSGRTVFSVYNFDINPSMFFFQEICMFTFFTLTVLVFHKVFSEIKILKTIDRDDFSVQNVITIVSQTRKSFQQWQILSIILFGVFGFYVYHFWLSVYGVDDRRYLFAAFSFNLYWALSWYICSSPTFGRLEIWNRYKIELLSRCKDSGSNNLLGQYLLEKDIVSSSNQFISTLLMVLSFILPLIKAMSE